MPQMAPMNWTTLFITFCIMFMIMNTINFYNSQNTPKSSQHDKKLTKMNWKW